MTAARAAFIADCIEEPRTARAYLNPHLKNTRSDTVAHAPAAACHVTSTNTTRTRKPAARTRFARHKVANGLGLMQPGSAAHLSTLLYSTFLTLKLSTVRLDAERAPTEKLTWQKGGGVRHGGRKDMHMVVL